MLWTHAIHSVLGALGTLLAAATLVSCATKAPLHLSQNDRLAEPVFYDLASDGNWGRTIDGGVVLPGGFSGLHFTGIDVRGNFTFIAITDRGPNGEAFQSVKGQKQKRPFLLPNFHPRIMVLQTNEKEKTFRILREIILSDPDGQPLTGIPQWPNKNKKHGDEIPVGLDGQIIEPDLLGIDPEGVTMDNDGFYWVSEEYRPSILKFDSNGRLMKRFVPKGSLPRTVVDKINRKFAREIVVEALPSKLKKRKPNRGFEGIAIKGDLVFAILQSPLPGHGGPKAREVSVIVLNAKSELFERELLYKFRSEAANKIGGLSSLSSVPNDTKPTLSEMAFIEQNSLVGEASVHDVVILKKDGTEESISLAQFHYDFEKVEGLAMIGHQKLAVINDNDFGVESDQTKGTVLINSNKKTKLAIFGLSQK